MHRVCKAYGGSPSERLGLELGDPVGFAIDCWVSLLAVENGWDPPDPVTIYELKK